MYYGKKQRWKSVLAVEGRVEHLTRNHAVRPLLVVARFLTTVASWPGEADFQVAVLARLVRAGWCAKIRTGSSKVNRRGCEMMTAFYKQQPTVDTPYRQLILEHSAGGWRVRLMGGTKWGRSHGQKLKVIPAKSFDAAKKAYDKVFGELQNEGWKPYCPFEPW